MLSNDDKKWIKELIANQYSDKGEYISESALKQNRSSLTFAETVQLKKLLAQRKTEEKLLNSLKKGASYTAAGIRGVADVTKNIAGTAYNTALGKNSFESLMYTNPLTAALYMNRGLFKAGKNIAGSLLAGTKNIGKGLWTATEKIHTSNNSRPLGLRNSSAVSLITSKNNTRLPVNNTNMLTSSRGTNYIVAKNAVFIGGKNNIAVADSYGSFGLSKLSDSSNSQPSISSNKMSLLGTKKDDVIELTKGIDGIYKATKESNKILGALRAKQTLIIGGILLGVATIAGLVAFLNAKFGGKSPKATPNVNSTTQFKKFIDYSLQSTDARINDIQKGINNEFAPTDLGDFHKIKSIDSNDGGLTKLGKALNNKVHQYVNPSGKHAQSKAGSVYRAPFNMKVIYKEENVKEPGAVNIIAEKIVPHGINKNIEIMNVQQCIVYENQIVKKGEPIGLIGSSGKIWIKDITDKDWEDYMKSLNDFAAKVQKDSFTLDDETNQKINEDYKNIANNKSSNPYKKSTSVKSNNPYNYSSTLSSTNESIENKKKLLNALNNNMGTYVKEDGAMRYISKENIKSELTKYDKINIDNYNNGNKNVEKIKNEAQKLQNKKSSVESTPKQPNPQKVTMEAGTEKHVALYSPQGPDLIAGHSSPLTIFQLG